MLKDKKITKEDVLKILVNKKMYWSEKQNSLDDLRKKYNYDKNNTLDDIYYFIQKVLDELTKEVRDLK